MGLCANADRSSRLLKCRSGTVLPNTEITKFGARGQGMDLQTQRTPCRPVRRQICSRTCRMGPRPPSPKLELAERRRPDAGDHGDPYCQCGVRRCRTRPSKADVRPRPWPIPTAAHTTDRTDHTGNRTSRPSLVSVLPYTLGVLNRRGFPGHPEDNCRRSRKVCPSGVGTKDAQPHPDAPRCLRGGYVVQCGTWRVYAAKRIRRCQNGESSLQWVPVPFGHCNTPAGDHLPGPRGLYPKFLLPT